VNFADQDRLDRVRGIAEEHHQDTTGPETWFSLPGESVPAPSKTKMVVVRSGGSTGPPGRDVD
jgi:hypothetical protein